MSVEPILAVIGIAIAANLVIMVVLVTMLVARRRGRLATPEGIAEPAPYRYSVMQSRSVASSAAASPAAPTVSRSYPYVDEEPASEPEDIDETVSAIEPTDLRKFRPVLQDEGRRVEETIESFFTGGSTGAAGLAASAPAPTPAPVSTTGGGRFGSGPTSPEADSGATARDALTGVDGRLNWEVRLRDEDARFARYRRPASIVLVELDGIERLLSRLGPEAVARIVPPVGATLQRQARITDHVARIGEGRFAILLPETDEIQAINYVERVRAECDRWLAAGAVSMRLAIGWACPVPGGDLRTAMRIAEDRLNADRRRPAPGVDDIPAPARPTVATAPAPEPEPRPAPAPEPYGAASSTAYELGPILEPDGAE